VAVKVVVFAALWTETKYPEDGAVVVVAADPTLVAPEAVVVVLEIVGFLAPPPVTLAFIPIFGIVVVKVAVPVVFPVIFCFGSQPAYATVKVAVPLILADPVKLKTPVVELYSILTALIVADPCAAFVALAAAIGI